MPTYTTIYQRWANIKYPTLMDHISYQQINNWTNVGPTLHTQHKVGQNCKPNIDRQGFMLMYHPLDQRWANIICPTKYWPRFMPTCTTMDQHWANIAYPTPTDKLSCQHIIRWTNVGPTFKLRRQQPTNHPTNNQRWPDVVLLSGMALRRYCKLCIKPKKIRLNHMFIF